MGQPATTSEDQTTVDMSATTIGEGTSEEVKAPSEDQEKPVMADRDAPIREDASDVPKVALH